MTTVWGGLDVGSAVGLLLSGPLIRMYGWPSVFYLFAVLGGIWCLMWPLVRPSMQVSRSMMLRNCVMIMMWGMVGNSSSSMERVQRAHGIVLTCQLWTQAHCVGCWQHSAWWCCKRQADC